MYIVTWGSGTCCSMNDDEASSIETIKNLMTHGVEFSQIRVFKVEEENFPAITIRDGK